MGIAKWLFNGKKRLGIAGGLACVLALAGGAAIPQIGKAYSKYQANSAVQETNGKLDDLRKTIDLTKNVVEQNGFILPEEEKQKYVAEIGGLQGRYSELEGILFNNLTLFKNEKYDAVRTNLQKGFDSKRSEELPSFKAEQVKQDVINLKSKCEGKRANRDCSIQQEGYVMARLASPLKADTVERKEKHLLLTDEQYNMIPILTPELEKQLAELNNPLLKNSMGANLVRHKPLLEHILAKGKTEKIKQYAQQIFNNATSNYSNARKFNDEFKSDSKEKWMTWYRANRDDGTFSQKDYENLLVAQKKVIDSINAGDSGVSHLKTYHAEIEAQYYTYVRSHEESIAAFGHTRMVPRVRMDSKGHLHTSLATEHYETEGFKYYYALETVTPNEHRIEKVYLGEKDSTNKSWDYAPNEQVGFLREWKRLHYSNEDKIKGGNMKEVKPVIEKE